jgi:hypothetical protein
MSPKAAIYRDMVADACAEAIAVEMRAGFPQGRTDRSFEAITADLVMADWERLCETLLVQQCIDRFCGLEKRLK